MIAITAPFWTHELLHNKLDVIFAPKYAPKTAPKNLELHLKFLSQNNRLKNMRSNLSSPTISFLHIDLMQIKTVASSQGLASNYA